MSETTDVMEKLAAAVVMAQQKRPSGELTPSPHPWKCEHEHRLDSMGEKLEDHDARIKVTETKLSDGNERFVRLESKLESVSEKLGELADTIKSAVRWVLGIVGASAAGGILWAMSQASKAVAP